MVVPFIVTRRVNKRIKSNCCFCGKKVRRGIFHRNELYSVQNRRNMQLCLCPECNRMLLDEINAEISKFCICNSWNINPSTERCANCPDVFICVNTIFSILNKYIGVDSK